MKLFSSFKVITITIRAFTLILTLLTYSLTVKAQENNELAIANEVIINSSPLHDEVAEKYLKIATGEQHTAIADITNSATKLFIPLDKSLPDGTVIHNDKPQSACRDLHTYIRQLRVGNSEIRKKQGRPKLVYNFLCSPNSILTVNALPNDSRIGELWAINQSNNVDLDLPEAWNKWTGGGSTEVVVAVVDTGIDYTHPDLAANMWKNTAELNGVSGVDDDRNGVIDDIYGFNAVTGAAKPGDPKDDHYHGTHVAGTIGGVGNNGQGVAGVAWNIKLMGAKFLQANGGGSTFDAVKAIDYITNQKLAGVNVVASNNSWGGGGYDPSLFDAINRANNAGILFIAAAGNSGINIDQNPSYPASYNVPNVISIGAIDAAGNLASFSNYGTGNVDIVAPGVSILSCSPNAGYQYLSGTSMATPQVSGAIALLKSYAPTMTMNQLRDTLYNTSKSVAGAIGKTKYGTMPSVYEMLREADRLGLGLLPPTPAPTSTPRPTATPTRTPTPTVTPTPTATIAPGYFAIKGAAIVGSKKLSHAKVTLQIGNQTLVTYTDANGAFSFMNVYGPVNYTLNVNSSGYTFSSYGSNLIGNVDLTLSGTVKNYVLKAKIINEHNQPVSGVSISDSTLGTVISGADGMVQFNVPYGSSYALYAQQVDSDFLASELSGQIFGDVTRVFVRLPD